MPKSDLTRLIYQNLDLLLEPAGANYRARVLNSPAGEATETVRLSATDLSAAGLDLKQVGGVLFDAVFTGKVATCLQRSLEHSEAAGQGVRIRLRLGDVPELANLPWEALYDRARDRVLALSRETPVVRYLELPEPVRPLTIQPPLRVLAVIASPAELPGLHVSREWANLQDALGDLTARQQVILERLEPPTLTALQNRLRETHVHVLHFIGHGGFDPDAGQGFLFLEDEHGHINPVAGADLGTLLADHQPLRLALLNACEGAQTAEHDPYGGVAQKLVQQGIPGVIAMRSAISDPAAVAFSHEFYAAVADGCPVDAAMADARRAIAAQDEDRDEWATPALFMRAPDGVLWETPTRKSWRQRLLGPLGVAIALPIVLVIAALAAWLALTPTQMPLHTFNVAVAEFGQTDTAGNVRASADGANLSRWMFEELRTEIAQLPGDHEIMLWHDSLGLLQKRTRIGRIAGKTADARALAAARLAKEINAHIVVYGSLNAGQNPAAFVPEFYSSEVKREADEVIGRQELGAPISVLTPIDFNDQVTVAHFDAKLKPKAQAIVWLAQGLAYDLAGQHDRALAVLQEADRRLTDWGQDQGREILHYFIGREIIFLTFEDAQAIKVYGSVEAALDAAEHAFTAARQINPQYARAHLGLGNVYYQRAQRGLLGPAEVRDPVAAADWLDQAVTEYDTARQAAQTSADPQVELRARLSLGNAYRLQGFAELDRPTPDYDAARTHFDAAIVEILAWLAAPPTDQPRTLAQSYQMLAATYQQKAHTFYAQGDRRDSQPWYEKARDAYASCSKLADQNIYDQTLQKIKMQSCEPNRLEMLRIIQELTGQVSANATQTATEIIIPASTPPDVRVQPVQPEQTPAGLPVAPLPVR